MELQKPTQKKKERKKGLQVQFFMKMTKIRVWQLLLVTLSFQKKKKKTSTEIIL